MDLEKSDKLNDINTTIEESFKPYYTDVFSPGETKEQLRVGKEVKGTSGGSMKIGHFTITATGDKVITGVGFQPTKINIIANVNGSTGILRSNGWYDTSTYCSYDYMTNSTHPQKSYYTTNQMVLIDDGSTGSFVSTYASFVSFDADGFTLNTSIQNQTVQCIYIAYE